MARGTASYKSRIYRGGTPIAATIGVTAGISSGFYQATTPTNQIWDPRSAITILVATSPGSPTRNPVYAETGGVPTTQVEDWSIDPYFGIVTKNSGTPPAANDVRISCSVVPTVIIGGAHQHTVSRIGELVDITDYQSNGNRTRIQTLKDVTASFSRFWVDPSGGATAQDFKDYINNDTPVLVEIIPGLFEAGVTAVDYDITSTPTSRVAIIRFWGAVESAEQTGDPASPEIESVTIQQGNYGLSFARQG